LSNYAATQQAISGIVASNLAEARALQVGTAGVTGSGWRIDAGNTGFSGWQNLSVSTAVSSIVMVVVTPAGGATPSLTSGIGSEFITFGYSGHAFDLYRHFSRSGGHVTSGGVSGIVSWMAVGI